MTDSPSQPLLASSCGLAAAQESDYSSSLASTLDNSWIRYRALGFWPGSCAFSLALKPQTGLDVAFHILFHLCQSVVEVFEGGQARIQAEASKHLEVVFDFSSDQLVKARYEPL